MQTFKYEKLLILINLLVEILFLIYIFLANPNILTSSKAIYSLGLIFSILFFTISLIFGFSKRIIFLKISATFAMIGGLSTLPLGALGMAGGFGMFKNINIVAWSFLIIFLISAEFLINGNSHNNKISSLSDKVYSTLQTGQMKNVYTKDEVVFLVKNITDCSTYNKDLGITNPKQYVDDIVICVNTRSNTNTRKYSLQELTNIVNIIHDNLTK